MGRNVRNKQARGQRYELSAITTTITIYRIANSWNSSTYSLAPTTMINESTQHLHMYANLTPKHQHITSPG